MLLEGETARLILLADNQNLGGVDLLQQIRLLK